jgi:hypothetical protein
MNKSRKNKIFETKESITQTPKINKLLRSILAASSLATIALGASHSFAATTHNTTGDPATIDVNGTALDNIDGGNFVVDDNVTFGGAHVLTNSFNGNVGIVSFGGNVGKWNQNVDGHTIAGVSASAGVAAILNINNNTMLMISNGDALKINVAADTELDFGPNPQTFGALAGTDATSKFVFDGGAITGTIDQGTLETTAATIFNGVIGGTNALTAITIGANTTFKQNVSAAAITVVDAMTLTFDNDGANTTVAGEIDGNGDGNGILATSGGNSTTFNGEIGGSDALAQITIGANTIFDGAVNTQALGIAGAHTATFAAGAHNLGAATLSDVGATLAFKGGTIEGDIAATAAGDGVVTTSVNETTFSGTLGAGNALGAINVEAKTTFNRAVNTQALGIAGAHTATFANVNHNLGIATLGNAGATLAFTGGTIGGTIDGAGDNEGILATSGANTTFNGEIGGGHALAAITVGANTTFNESVKAAAITVADAMKLTLNNAGVITGTISGAEAGKGILSTGAKITFNNVIGGGNALAEIALGESAIFKQSVSATAIRVVNGSTLTFDRVDGGDTVVAGTINGSAGGNETLEITGGNSTTFNGAIGETNLLSAINVKANTVFGGSVKAANVTVNGGTAAFNGPTTITLGLTVTKGETTFANADHSLTQANIAVDQSIKFNGGTITGMIDGAVDDEGTLVTNGGITTTFSGEIGGKHALAAINVGADTTFNNNVSAVAISVADGKTLTFGNAMGATAVTGTIDGDAAGHGILATTKAMTFNGAIGGNQPLAAITVGADATFNETVNAANVTVNGGTVEFSKLTKLTLGLTVTNGNTIFANADHSLTAATIAAGRSIEFNGGTIGGTIDGAGDNEGILTIYGNPATFTDAIGAKHALARIIVEDNTTFSGTVNTQALSVVGGTTATFTNANHNLGAVELINANSILKFAAGNSEVSGEITAANVGQIDASVGSVKWTGDIGEAGNSLGILKIGAAQTFDYAGGNAYVSVLTFDNANSVLNFSGAGSFTLANLLATDALGTITTSGKWGGDMIVNIQTGAAKQLNNITLSHNVGNSIIFERDLFTAGGINIQGGGDTKFDGNVTLNAGNISLTGASSVLFVGNIDFSGAANKGFVIQDENSVVAFDLDGADRNVTVEGTTQQVFTLDGNNNGILSIANSGAAAKLSFVGADLTKVSDKILNEVNIYDNATLAIGSLNLSSKVINLTGATATLSADAGALAANGTVEINAPVVAAANNNGVLNYTVAAGKNITHNGAVGNSNEKVCSITINGVGNGVVIFNGAVNTFVMTTAADTETRFAPGNHALGALNNNNNGTVTFGGGTISGTIDGGRLNAFGTYSGAIGATTPIANLEFWGDTTFQGPVTAQNTDFSNATVVLTQNSSLGNVIFNNSTVDIGSNTITVDDINIANNNNFAIDITSNSNGKIVSNGATHLGANPTITLNIKTVRNGRYIISQGTNIFDDATIRPVSPFQNIIVVGGTLDIFDRFKPSNIVIDVVTDKAKKAEHDNNINSFIEDNGGNADVNKQIVELLDLLNNPSKNPELAAQLQRSETSKLIDSLYSSANSNADMTSYDQAIEPAVVSTQTTITNVLQAVSAIDSRLGEITQGAFASISSAMAPSSGENPDDHKFGVWGSAHASKAEQKLYDSNPAYKLTSNGGTIGADFKPDFDNRDVVLGGAFTFDNGDLKYNQGIKTGDKTTIKTNIFSLYSHINFDKGLFARTTASYGTSDVKAKTARDGKTATADYTSKFNSVQIEGGYNHAVGSINAVTTLGGRYINIKNPQYTETGAGILNQTTKKDTSDEFALIASFGLNSTIVAQDVAFVPHIKFSVSQKISGKTPTVRYTVGDLPAELNTDSGKVSKTYGEVSSGLSVKKNSLDFGIKGSYGFARNFQNWGGAITVRANF